MLVDFEIIGHGVRDELKRSQQTKHFTWEKYLNKENLRRPVSHLALIRGLRNRRFHRPGWSIIVQALVGHCRVDFGDSWCDTRVLDSRAR